MKWQLLDHNNEPLADVFDDGLKGSPGTDGFTTDAVAAAVKSNPDAAAFNYMGESEIAPTISE